VLLALAASGVFGGPPPEDTPIPQVSPDAPRAATSPPAPTHAPSPAADGSPAPDATTPGPVGSPAPRTASPLPVEPAPAPTPSASAEVEPDPGDLALVPVVGFWSSTTEISLLELERALSGTNTEFERVMVPEGYQEDVAAALGITLGANVETGDDEDIRQAVRQGALGLLRVGDINPAVRALALDGQSLFGNDRLLDLDEWPLTVPAQPAAGWEWEQSATWTLVAGGDIQLDRWMAYHVTTLDKGVDWPWDGGTVAITGRVCCSDLGHRVPEWEFTGNEGAVRALFAEADLAMANLEAAAVNNPRFHRLNDRFRFSLSFSGDPRLLDGLKNAGFDFLSLANNHIHDAGSEGIRDTRQNLEDRGIASAGAGQDLEQARQPAQLEVAGQQVVVLPCITVGRVARADRAGAAPCTGNRLVRQIEEAAADADVVIVFPHWGREYRATPNTGQRQLARRWAEAGADLVLGAHSHWTGSIEEIGESLVFYSMGNLAFDQPWSEATMQGVILELTFQGDRLVQVRLHPTLIVDHVQPNLLEYVAGGDRVIERMRDASEGMLPY
jgi:hypothetical protein